MYSINYEALTDTTLRSLQEMLRSGNLLGGEYLLNRDRYRPSPNVRKEGDNVVVEVEVPGIEPSDIKVSIEGRSLLVETPKGNHYLTVGQRLETEEATARIKHGVLTVTIPKREAKTVQVNVSED